MNPHETVIQAALLMGADLSSATFSESDDDEDYEDGEKANKITWGALKKKGKAAAVNLTHKTVVDGLWVARKYPHGFSVVYFSQ